MATQPSAVAETDSARNKDLVEVSFLRSKLP